MIFLYLLNYLSSCKERCYFNNTSILINSIRCFALTTLISSLNILKIRPNCGRLTVIWYPYILEMEPVSVSTPTKVKPLHMNAGKPLKTKTNIPTNVPAKLGYVFSSEVPRETLVKLITDICYVSNGWYIYDIIAFRRLIYKERYESFANEISFRCKPYLKHMIIRVPTFYSLMVIILHICRQHSILTEIEKYATGKKKEVRIWLNV